MKAGGLKTQTAPCHSNSRHVSTSQTGGCFSQAVGLGMFMLEHPAGFENLAHPARIGRELGRLADRERAWPRKIDVHDLDDPAGPRCHYAYSIGEQDGLGDAVRHEDDRLDGAHPDVLELQVELIAGQRIERTERLV